MLRIYLTVCILFFVSLQVLAFTTSDAKSRLYELQSMSGYEMSHSAFMLCGGTVESSNAFFNDSKLAACTINQMRSFFLSRDMIKEYVYEAHYGNGVDDMTLKKLEVCLYMFLVTPVYPDWLRFYECSNNLQNVTVIE